MNRHHSKRGAVLIIVVGLVAMLLVLASVFLARMRSDAQEIRPVLQEAQCRLALTAACQYLQESSRIGWGARNADGSFQETFGWTDVRGFPDNAGSATTALDKNGGATTWNPAGDQWIGPAGPRIASGSAAGTIAKPAWWDVGTYPTLPPLTTRHWPYPGTATRCDLSPWRQPPCAVSPAAAGNPVFLADANWDRKQALITAWTNGAGACDVQPQAATFTEWLTGSRITTAGMSRPDLLPEAAFLGWFRVYREDAADHNNDQKDCAGTASWHDTVPLSGWGVFVVAVGAGATRGYRFWDASDASYSPELGADLAKDSGFWTDKADFLDARDRERIEFFRIAWTARQGGNFDASTVYGRTNAAGVTSPQVVQELTRTPPWRGGPNNEPIYDGATRSLGGTIEWVQRLDREPSRW
jgi:hypothetical protein